MVGPIRLACVCSAPKSWEKWARPMSCHYAANVRSEESYWTKDYVKLYESFLKLHVDNPKVQGLDREDAREAIEKYNGYSDDEKRGAKYYYSPMGLALQWKRLAITERGDLTVVQRLPKVGDRVCILPGSKMPFLIRPMLDSDDLYQLVGESYVDSLMCGEGLSMGPLQDIVLV